MRISFLMAKNFLKIFTRDRQAIFFILVLPSILIIVFGIISARRGSQIDIGVTSQSAGAVAQDFIGKLNESSAFNVAQGDEETLSSALLEKRLDVVVVLPESFADEQLTNQIIVKIDSSQQARMALALPALRQIMNDIEHDIHGTKPMFELKVEDVQVNSLRYIDFVLPGLIAMMVMNISLSGSGSNTVEYRRKGILKRLFVTPIKPREFITGVVLARSSLSLMSVFLSIAIAVYAFNVQIVGSIFTILLIVFLGLAVFLCIGFTLGSWAKTQQSIQSMVSLVTFPQIILSGIFFPIDSWPAFVQPIASVLPLTFIATALREVATNGLNVLDILPSMVGILIWLILGFIVATRYFVWKEVAN